MSKINYDPKKRWADYSSDEDEELLYHHTIQSSSQMELNPNASEFVPTIVQVILHPNKHVSSSTQILSQSFNEKKPKSHYLINALALDATKFRYYIKKSDYLNWLDLSK